MKEVSKIKDKKGTPSMQRIHGHDISLMVEIVYDNEVKDLFPNKTEGVWVTQEEIKDLKGSPTFAKTQSTQVSSNKGDSELELV